MKKFALLLASVLLLCTFVSCANEEDQRTPGYLNETTDPSVLENAVSWFDQVAFESTMSQRDFTQWLRTFTYDGENLIEHLSFYPVSQNGASGITASAMEYSYSATKITDYTHQTTYQQNTLTVRDKIDGLNFPADIELGDDTAAVLTKLGVSFDPSTQFTPNEGSTTNMNLLTSETASLTYIDMAHSSTGALYPVSITLIEHLTDVGSDKIDSDRSVTFSFDAEGKLACVEMWSRAYE